MKPCNVFTDFKSVRLPPEENDLSRRYLRLIMRWVPTGMSYFNEWPVRPECGHFLGGVLWYGQETGMIIETLAIAASSPEFDAKLAGTSADELRAIAHKGLRYLCFTHDTGPADCVRPQESWGRPEPAGTKWGERGKGFFRESQCGGTIASLALTAALTHELINDEDREMLANIAADYMQRFGAMEPKSGLYNDTQAEENAWTALGMTACMMLLPKHENIPVWKENTELWMFRGCTQPQDAHDFTRFTDGKSVRELCSRSFTILPDGTAENHGFVHPSYMASPIALGQDAMALLQLYGAEVPQHLLWHRRQTYEILKTWSDDNGALHCVQGMDWPYLMYPGCCRIHAAASLCLHDPDAARLERRALAVVEKASLAHGGRMVPEAAVEFCHGQQDPAFMRERMVVSLARAYFGHHLAGPGTGQPRVQKPGRTEGVYLYPHGGVLLHRHGHGITSLSWRNRTMVLPCTRDGMKLIGPAHGTMLAAIEVKGRPHSTRIARLKIREHDDRAAALLEECLASDSVLRRVFFASLPNGKCLTYERLTALADITVEQLRQGSLSIMNDGYFGENDGLRGQRTVYREGAQHVFEGYPAATPDEDLCEELSGTRWVNIDDRCGLVFEGTERAVYCNRHYFKVWHAVKDELVLNLREEPRDHGSGTEIAGLIALWCPEQRHEQTAGQDMQIVRNEANLVIVRVDDYLCTCNFGDREIDCPGSTLSLEPHEPAIARL